MLRDVRLVDGIAPTGEPIDVLIDHGHIVRMGSGLVDVAEVDVPGDGRWLIPGLWDHHVHMEQWALAASRLDVSAATSADQVAVMLRDAPMVDGILVGVGFRDALWPTTPTAETLEAVPTPVVLISADVHTTWANRAALHLLNRPDSHWWLREQEAFDLGQQVNDMAEPAIDALVDRAAREAASRGVTGIVDLEMRGGLAAWSRRSATGFDRLRVEIGVYPDELDRAPAPTGTVLSPLLTMGRLKLFVDGSLNTRTAWCHEPYGDGGQGMRIHEAAALRSLIRAGLARGVLPTIHAIGDAAVTEALDACAELAVAGRIEHAQLVAESDLRRFADLGVEASVQPAHLLDDEPVARAVWPDRHERSFCLRALKDSGARLLFGSDAPVAALDPWRAMAAAVDRAWNPEQRLTPAEALVASTGGRRLTVGAVADLALCSLDPLDSMNVERMTVAATWIGGRLTSGESWN